MKTLFLFALVSIYAPIAPAFAKTLEGVTFEESLNINGTRLELNGAGLLKVAVIFKVYVAALYLGEGFGPESVFDDVPKRIEISYLRSISTNIIFEAGDAALARNVPADALAQLQPRLDRINSLYQNVDKGDCYAITYLPGVGSELSLNGRSLGTIEGADFASAYFTIWLGKDAPKPELRDALLKRKN